MPIKRKFALLIAHRFAPLQISFLIIGYCGQTSQCISTSSSGDYYVTVTEAGGCTASSNHITVNVYPSPPVSISVNGDTLSAYNAVGYQWYLNGQALTGDTTNMIVVTQNGTYTVVVTDSNGCGATSSGRYVDVSGIGDIAAAEIKVYPNPLISGNWQIELNGNWPGAWYELYDVSGKLVYKAEIKSNRDEINLNIESGIYLFQLHSQNNNTSLKLVKL